MNLAFLNGFSVLLTSFIVVVVVILLMLIFLFQSFIYFFFIELYSAHLIYAVAMFFDMPILYFMALSYALVCIECMKVRDMSSSTSERYYFPSLI